MSSSRSTVYLFAGDSLTEAAHGESFVARVGAGLPGQPDGLGPRLVNAGLGGETVRSLLARIEGLLREVRPQLLVLAIGTNDAWFHWLSSHSLGWWLRLQVRALHTGQVATADLDGFAACYRALIDRSRATSSTQVLACTLSPVGEALSSPLNLQVARLNGVIQRVAAERRVPVADVWQGFVEQLALERHPSRHLPRAWWSSAFDRRRLRRMTPDQLARRRGLRLTCDGIHLNGRGADLWAATILHALGPAAPIPRKGNQHHHEEPL
jgi:lysophospholipase L1-like esterase